MNFKELTRPLESHEIELRIGSNGKNNNGFSLLLYKTARTDRNRLDKSFTPLGWQRDHKVLKDVIYCGIGVKDESDWVWKWDAGTESFTEKQKGEASDSFKRAGFAWGIGIELYDSPFIWINWSEWKNNKPVGARVQNWKVILKNESEGIYGGFSIVDEKGNLQWGAGVSLPKGVENIDYLKEIKSIWKDSRFEPFKTQLKEEYGMKSWDDLNESILEDFYNSCMNKIKLLK